VIAKTRTLNNSAFTLFTAVSLFMSLWLFYQFGSNIFSASILCICGAAVETFKILTLLRWRNQVEMKRKKKNHSLLLIYLMIALASCFASMAFGVKEIEKVSVRQLGDTGTAQVIEMRIAALKKKAGHKNTAYIAGLRNQIEILKGQIPSRGLRIIEKTKQINDEISKINARIAQASQVSDNRHIHDEIQRLKGEYAAAKFHSVDSKGAFAVMAETIGVTVNTIMLVFLAFVTITIELGIAQTSSGFAEARRKPAKRKKREKRGEKGQITLFNHVA
jgi:TolA-binding protein